MRQDKCANAVFVGTMVPSAMVVVPWYPQMRQRCICGYHGTTTMAEGFALALH